MGNRYSADGMNVRLYQRTERSGRLEKKGPYAKRNLWSRKSWTGTPCRLMPYPAQRKPVMPSSKPSKILWKSKGADLNVKLGHVKPDMVRDGMNRPVSQSVEPIRIKQFHANMVKPAVIENRHHIHRSEFEQFCISPIVYSQSVPAICHVSQRHQYGFLQAFHSNYPITSSPGLHPSFLWRFLYWAMGFTDNGSDQCGIVCHP